MKISPGIKVSKSDKSKLDQILTAYYGALVLEDSLPFFP